MALRMARPVRLKNSPNVYFRGRIPADVLAKARGTTIIVPVGPERLRVKVSKTAVELKFSLGTSDKREGALRHAAAADYVLKYWDALRRGPAKLTHKQAVALAGEIYADLTRVFENNPAKFDWQEVQKINQEAFAGEYGVGRLLIGEEARCKASIAERFGGFADVVLARHGLVVDDDSRTKLAFEVGRALNLSAKRLQRNAQGDYSPDPNLAAFGRFDMPASGAQGGMSWDDLVDAWAKEANPKQATIDQWRSTLRELEANSGVRNPAALTKDHVVRWKETLLDAGLSQSSINDSKLAALNTVLNWAVNNGKLEINVARGVKVRRKKQPGSDMKGFSDEQAAAILRAAASSAASTYRWVPFLCALSGARVSELTQLRGADIAQQDGIFFMRLRNDAGSVKNDPSEREVPLHPHLIETGFLEFAKSKGSGPLFYNPARRAKGAKKPPPKIVAKNVGSWVRKLKIEGVGRRFRLDPQHGWRHRFKTKARAKLVPDSVIDRIQGQTPATVGHAYGTAELRTMYDVVRSIEVPGFEAQPARAA